MTDKNDDRTNNSTDDDKNKKTQIRKIGFCGADDSVSPRLMGLICQSYPFVEFGILFRPDKEGEPRYATSSWIKSLSEHTTSSSQKMKLAAHLCGQHVNDVLEGKDHPLLSTLYDMGFRRVQINATAVNGVDTSKLGEVETVENLMGLVGKYGNLEFILQRNEETLPLCDGVLEWTMKNHGDGDGHRLPSNVTMLVDESKGTGVLAKSWPNPPEEYDIGYAGGIGPGNIRSVLREVTVAGNGRAIWIDMESSLRSVKDGRDVFDLDKCFECIEIACEEGYFDHPCF